MSDEMENSKLETNTSELELDMSSGDHVGVVDDNTNPDCYPNMDEAVQENEAEQEEHKMNSMSEEILQRMTINDVEKEKNDPEVDGTGDAIPVSDVETLVKDTSSQHESSAGKTDETDNDNESCDNESSNNVTDSNNTEIVGDNKDTELEYFSDESESGDEYESAEEGEEIQTDSANLKDLEEKLTEEEKEERQCSARAFKEEGNQLFRDGSYKSAIRMYSRGLRMCPLKYEKDRAVLYANRAACKVKLEEFDDAIRDCTKALDLNPDYMKALVRRAELYEQTDKLEEALADYQKILQLDPSNHKARASCMKLPDIIKERNEKLKEEMMGKLKELGNMVLRPFGLSTNNFKMNQDPNTGGYSVNFVQNADNGS